MEKQTSNITTDHEYIRRWTEERGGHPAAVKRTQNGGSTIIRIAFPDSPESLEPIEWQDFFDIFEKEGLAFLYQEETGDGKLSKFNKFINRQ